MMVLFLAVLILRSTKSNQEKATDLDRVTGLHDSAQKRTTPLKTAKTV